ncbi:MAG: amidohydrolase [Salinivirgaceae bacterium]|nr:amidohydrolase [Salinivirgaceae bacterium]
MKRKIQLAIYILSILMIQSCDLKTEADLIIKNAKIYTVDSNFSVVPGAVIIDGKFVAVGPDATILARYKSANVLDLKGKFVYPGFIDPHCHFYGYGLSLAQVDLRGTSSYAEVIERAKKHHNEFNTQWLTGRGWDQNSWEGQEFPTKELLDEAFPNIPVLLRRIDGHAAIANSLALKKAGITSKTIVEGGKVIVENGEPTGLLIDKAVDKVLEIIPLPSKEEESKGLEQAQENCFAVGLTSVSDAGLNKATIELIDELQKADSLIMQIYAMLEATEENIEHFLKKGHYQSNKLNVRSLKLYADGALGSRGACLLEPYSDDTENYGMLLETPEYLKQMCQLAFENNYQVNTHCIGDSANRLMLNIYREILKEKNDLRWRIEHAQVVNSEDVKLYGKYSIIPSMQTTHCTSDMYWADERLGERISDAYIWQDLHKQNGWFPNGSDFPIEDINPLYGFYAGITRQDKKGLPKNGFFPKQKLTRTQALKAMTIWAAKAQFEEDQKGSIEVGKNADFVITSKNIMTCDPLEIVNLTIDATYLTGKKVYSATR